MPARKKATARKSTTRKSPAVKKKAGTRKSGSKQVAKKKAASRKVIQKATRKAPAKKAGKPTPKALKAARQTTPAKATTAAQTKGGGAAAGRPSNAPAIRSKGRRRAKPRKHVPPPPHLTGKGIDERKSKLGIKWSCYVCGAKFYDLNQPEPLCPKCGADQRERPAVPATPPPPAPKAKEPKPLAPYLDDDDVATRDESLTPEDLDLELDGRVSAGDDIDVDDDPPMVDLDDAVIADDD